jgi:hypothetical protein
MHIQLTWQKTGDNLLFDVINTELAKWFVSTCQRLGNQFSQGSQVIDRLTHTLHTGKLIEEEKIYIQKVNNALKKLNMPLFDLPTNWHDQRQLNKLHKDWGESRIKWPKLTELFYKIDQKLFEAYQEMNCHIHFIERSFNWTFRDLTHWRQTNPFKDNFYDWQVCHLYLNYPGHGRNAFEKFQTLDTYEDIYRDNVNWDNIDASIGINLMRPYTITAPQEFLTWCKEKELTPHGHELALGNLVDWEKNLTMARKIFTKNVVIEGNYFYLEITT